MRDVYHDELDSLGTQLVDMTHMVGSAMARATTAMLDADLQLAEGVIDADEKIDSLHHDLEERAFDLLARQQPVARDLRTIITSLRMSADLERMGDLAKHVAEVARRRYPHGAVPDELHSTVLEMGQVAQRIAAKAADVLVSRDVNTALELERDDDDMDRLHRRLFTILLDKDWPHGVEPAIDVILVGRYYERYADHAVSVANRIVYLVTGERPHDLVADQPPA